MQETGSDLRFDDSSDFMSALRSAFRAGKESLFHLFYLCCPSITAEQRYHTSRSALFLWVALTSIRGFQMLSLLYPVESVLSDWGKYRLWTTLVSLFRFDAAAAELGFQTAFYYIAVAVTILPALLYAAMFRSLTKHPKREWSTLRFLFSLTIQLQSGPLFLPLLCSFLASLRSVSDSTLEAYSYQSSIQLPNVSLHYMSVVWILILLLTSSLAQIFIYDIFFPNAKHHYMARAHSKIEFLGLMCQLMAGVSHFYLHYTAFLLHYCLCTVLFSMMLFHYCYYLPFYRLGMNWLHGMGYFLGAWGGVAVVISYIVDSAACGLALTILLPIAMSPILWDLFHRRVTYIKRTYVQSFITLRNCYLGELAIRYVVKDYLLKYPAKHDEQMEEFYNQHLAPLFNRQTAKFQMSMFPSLWEFAYIYSVVHDSNIARVKLTKSAQCPFDLEGCFNQYRFQQLLVENSQQNSEEATYVNFRIQFDTAKKADEESCLLQSRFWSELTAEQPQPERAERLANQVNTSLQITRSLLAKLVQNYPKIPLALRLFGTYLTEVLNDTEHGRELINRSMYEESELNARKMQMESKVSYFDDSNGVIMVAGSVNEVGNITYINDKAAEMLSVPRRLAIGMNVCQFIPQSLCTLKQHNLALLNYLQYCTGEIVHMPDGFFFQDFHEFMLEVQIQMKPTSLDLNPFFLVAMRREDAICREICLIDTHGIIQTHSRGFPILVGYCDQELLCKGLSADAMLLNYSSLSKQPSNEVFPYTLPGTINQVHMKFVTTVLGNVTYRVLLATTNMEETNKWLGKDAPDSPKLPPIDSSFLDSKSKTLKSILRKTGHKISTFELKFDLVPVIFTLTETDFPPGRSEYGKQKDAAPIDPKQDKSEETGEKADTKEKENANSVVFDLRDLDDFIREKRVEQQPKGTTTMLSELTDGRPKGQSLASSAVSSNSSFTSTKTAKDLLKVVNTSMKRFKFSFLFTNLTVILGVMAMLIYLLVSSTNYQNRLIVSELSDRRDLTSLLAFDTRNLLLLTSGFLPLSLETDIRARMQTTLSQFDLILQQLTDQFHDFDS